MLLLTLRKQIKPRSHTRIFLTSPYGSHKFVKRYELATFYERFKFLRVSTS